MKVTMKMIDKELRLIAFFMSKVDVGHSPEVARKHSKRTRSKVGKIKSKTVDWKEEYLARPDGSKLRVLIFKSKNPKPNAVGFLYIHGGGLWGGCADDVVNEAENFISIHNTVIVSPDYRLSIEVPYPAAADDCYLALEWLKKHAEELGVNKNQIFVGGTSAGGGLAVATCLRARDTREVNVAFQMPIMPMLDDRNNTDSMKENNAPVWDEKCNQVAWQIYLGELYGTANVPTYAAPGRENNLKGMPPLYTFVGSVDPFLDETLDYVERLKAEGIEAKAEVYEGAFHGFFSMCPKAQISKKAVSNWMEAYKEAAQKYYAEN